MQSMPNALPSLQSSEPAVRLSLQTAEALLGAALGAHKAGQLAELLQRRPRATRWLARRYLRPLQGTAGDALRGETGPAEAVAWLLRWAVSQLRPDRLPSTGNIERACWLDRPGWRPMLAVACHFGFELVPAFSDRYRRRADEAVVDNLCGLWSVGPSTFYRYVEQGKRRMAQMLIEWPPNAERRLSIRRFVQQQLDANPDHLDGAQRTEWHRRQAKQCVPARDAASALWHWLQAQDAVGFTECIGRLRSQLAGDPEADLLIEQFALCPLAAADACALWLAWASLWRTRNLPERELLAYERALQIAATNGQPRLLGNVSAALGRFYEARDIDRALAYLEDASEFLRQAVEQGAAEAESGVVDDYASTLLKLAWLYLIRNDPRSRALLERSELCCEQRALSSETQALLQQAWGEYWSRAGDLERALQHKHRALNIFERLGDSRQILSTFNNLSTVYIEVGDYGLAIQYAQKVLGAKLRGPVEPYLLSSVHLNLGAAYFLRGSLAQAIEHYRTGLEQASAAGLPVHVNRAHYNLAEAHYKRFLDARDPEDERLGDEHSAHALKASPEDSDIGHLEATRSLKREVLGEGIGFVHERLLPEEFAAHFDDMSEVQRQRELLALPNAPEVHVRAHLGIALAHLNVAAKEREAALQLIRKHQLGDDFADEFNRLGRTFNRALTREQQLESLWKERVGDLLSADRVLRVLRHALDAGSINKSAYAEVCGVSLATASKQLGALVERGLLEQTGKGPSTRYLLHDAGRGAARAQPLAR